MVDKMETSVKETEKRQRKHFPDAQMSCRSCETSMSELSEFSGVSWEMFSRRSSNSYCISSKHSFVYRFAGSKMGQWINRTHSAKLTRCGSLSECNGHVPAVKWRGVTPEVRIRNMIFFRVTVVGPKSTTYYLRTVQDWTFKASKIGLHSTHFW